ncbi:hypothetical protein [Rickettsia endosymbiont of Nabis limbatus]|uniref:hypothetical protein n=1 Tax=Rickettsia endosymbiont of Nabis limbatus TaxID=3066268 RepID=UPI003AF38AA1
MAESYNTIEKLDNTLLNSAIFITDNRKEQILNLEDHFNNNLPKQNNGNLLKIKNLKKLINFESYPKSINDQIAKLAVQDTVLLICKLLNNNPDIINCTKSILQTDNFKASIETNIDNILLFERNIETIGNTVLSNTIFDE